eukprot:CAMPEP_0171294624 /NCGR_PEP_ID=MMETSP0816-20121228/3123_1 /TAXON_ID=420281 /ORGANISM="Proboscia inermis, Strain CCAP1064/1" /LENGTH=787 /DNA_ID=CAMNT_0011766621 /DNA_START=177 /DNA_END=2543 /DNA_ORIENTATION=-
MAGRTFNDITQYPVFPWILSDYTSETLDLNDSRVYRDLSKPVGALDPDRLSQVIERYHNLDGFPEEEKFLYGSHYSSPGVVLYYLIRQEPFTSMVIDLQSGRFDCPDRLFYDMAGCFRCCMTLTSDVKELIPEFFTCPEMLSNSSNFPLGETQDRTKIHDVVLPPWANGSAHEFVRLHNLALESDYVSQNLHHWIDLIFGYKQRGPAAAAAHNVFHFLSYEGSVDLNLITDEVDLRATESHIQNFGQTPTQLMVKEPHPNRYPTEDCWKSLCSEVPRLRNLRCWTPTKQFGGATNSEAFGAVVSIQVLFDYIIVIYADMSVGTYRWYARNSGNTPFYFKMERLRVLGRSRSVAISPFSSCSTSRSSSSSSSSSAAMLDATTASSIASAKSRAELVSTHLDNLPDKTGIIPTGSWSFGLTFGGLTKENLSRKTTPSSARAIEGPATADLSSYLLSCNHWDDTVKMHTLDGLRLKESSNGGHIGPINCLSMGADGGLMVTGGHDGTCRVWMVLHSNMASALADTYVQTALGGTSGNGNASSNEDGFQCCHILWGHESSVTCLAFNTDLDIVVSGSIDGMICVHSVRRGEFVRTIRIMDHSEMQEQQQQHQHQQTGYNKFDPSLSSSPAVNRILDQRQDVRREIPGVRKLALSSGGLCVSHMDDGMLHMCTVNDVRICSVHAGDRLNAMEICPGGEMLVTGGDNCYVIIRNMRDLGVRCVLDLSSHGPIRCLSFTSTESNPAPQFMYVGTEDGMVTIVDADPAEANNLDGAIQGLPQYRVHDGRSNMKNW